MNSEAVAKIAMIKGSMRCFAFGLLAFLPVIGLPFALAALWIGGRVRLRERQYWNAAKPYRIWGVICAGAGSIFWGMIVALFIYNTVTGSWNGDQ